MAYIDPCDVSPNYYKTLFDNETLRVVEMTLPAGHKDTQHSHPVETVYFIKGGKVRIYVGDESRSGPTPSKTSGIPTFTRSSSSHRWTCRTCRAPPHNRP